MVQAILNIEMPESCFECPFSKGNYTQIICKLTGNIDEDNGKWTFKVYGCPLRKYKEKKHGKEKEKLTHHVS